MSAFVAVFVIVGTAIGSFAIPPHRLFRTQREPLQLRTDQTLEPTHEEPR